MAHFSMSWLGRFPVVAFLIAGVPMALLGACDSGGMEDSDPPETPDSVTIAAEAITDNGARIDSAAILFDGDEVGTGYAEQTYEEDPNRDVTVRSEEDDYVSTEKVVSLDSDRSVSLEMLEELPETVTVPFENIASAGDSLVAHTIAWNDSVVVEEPTTSGTAEIPASREEGQLCAQESDLFNEGCITLTPTSDITETQPIEVDRKTVDLTVSGDLPYGGVSEAEFSVITGKDTVSQFTGEKTLQLPKLAEDKTRKVAGNLVTDDPERDGRLDRLTGETSVSANTDVEATVGFETLPACSDDIQNDPETEEDEFIDVWEDENGDGLIQPEEGDPGCTGPEDDNEGHITWVQSVGSGGEGNDLTLFVSSKEGEREIFFGDALIFPESIKDAIVVNARVEVKVESGQDGEEFAMEFACGPDNDNQPIVNLTDVTDDQGRDGWVFTRLRGITADWFAQGTDCAQSYLHATKVRDEEPGDGNDNVFFLVAGDDTIRGFQIRWTIEEEDNHKQTQKVQPAELAKHGSKTCWSKKSGKLCASTGTLKAW